MNTPEYQPPLPPEGDCEHGVDAWTLCGDCLDDLTEDRGILGGADLVGMTAGLALDLYEDGQVTAYILRADVVAYDSGGFSDAWVTSGEQVQVAPHVVLVHPVEPVTAPTEEIARFCELVSEWATLLLPAVDLATEQDDPEGLIFELASWLTARNIGPQGTRLVFHVVRLLGQALMRLEEVDS